MNIKKRIFSVLIIIGIVGALLIGSHFFTKKKMEMQSLNMPFLKDTIHLWYTDDALTEYLNQLAVSYYEEKDIRVECSLVSGLEYLEQINRASLSEEEEIPDLFIVSNDLLEKAYLAGLASEIKDDSGICSEGNFSQAAIDAVTYQDKRVGYPYYFETSALVYNKTYLEQIAKVAAEEELGITPTDEENTTNPLENCDEQVKELAMEKADAMIPGTILDIINFANQYDAPGNVESIFKWDVSDIFFNYFFIGNYISAGGSAGCDKGQVSIYNEDAIASLKVYQDLNQFFSIESDEVNYDTVVQEFEEGKIIFTIATSDILTKLENAKAEGNFDYEYGVAAIPDINNELSAKGMSVTETIAVNGYSEHKEQANQFAQYLCDQQAASLYDKTKKIACNQTIQYENEWISKFVEQYADSQPVPKMLETSNFWILLENCFTKVWSGEDANKELKSLSEHIMTQILGSPYEETYIETPQVNILPSGSNEESGD